MKVITLIFMASGFSRRMGENKLIKSFAGKPLIQWCLEATKGLEELEGLRVERLVVYQDDTVKELAENNGCKVVYNPNSHEGQSASIGLGIGHSQVDTDAYIFLTGDQPFITMETLLGLIEAHGQAPKGIIQPYYNGRKGAPVLFSAYYREELATLDGDQGGRQVIRRHPQALVRVDRPELEGVDMDTQEDFQYWEREFIAGRLDIRYNRKQEKY